MQQEAILRVREMQQRARHTLESAGMTMEPPEPPVAEVPPLVQAPPQEIPFPADVRRAGSGPAPPLQGGRQPPGGIFGLGGNGLSLPGFNLSLDSEQLILLGILYILYRDHSDPWLMMAVAYVLFF